MFIQQLPCILNFSLLLALMFVYFILLVKQNTIVMDYCDKLKQTLPYILHIQPIKTRVLPACVIILLASPILNLVFAIC